MYTCMSAILVFKLASHRACTSVLFEPVGVVRPVSCWNLITVRCVGLARIHSEGTTGHMWELCSQIVSNLIYYVVFVICSRCIG